MANPEKDNMSPDSSPSSKSGVRRVNNLPLFLCIAALATFIVLIAMVAAKRANHVAAIAPDVTQNNVKKPSDTSSQAKNVIGDHDSGLIGTVKDNDASKKTGIPTIPVPLDPNAPPLPPSDVDKSTHFEGSSPSKTETSGSHAVPNIPDPQTQQLVDQIKQVKTQQFQEAVKAKTNVSINSPSQLANNLTNSAPQTRDEMLARIAEVNRQISNANTPDLNSSYQTQLASLKGSGTQNSSSSTTHNDVSQFGLADKTDRWKLDQDVQAPRSKFEVRAGSVISGVMISGVNSDLPGQIMGQVSQDVYDTATGKYLLIPQGTRVVATYSSSVVYGQQAILIAFQRLVFPDGKALDISAMPGADSAGYSGFRDQVNNHYLRIFTSAFLMSGVTAAAAYATDRSNTSGATSYTPPTMSNELSQALGQQLGNVTTQMIAKNLNIAPTLEIRPGYRFNIIVVKDLDFTKPYKSFDY